MGKSKTRPLAILYALTFVCALWVPLLAAYFGWDKARPLRENRVLAEMPVFQINASGLRDFPKAFEAYFNDHLGFRNTLIRMQDWLKVHYLGTSASPQVLLGKHGWLYLGGDVVTYNLAAKPLTEGELARWQTWLEGRRDWLADRNIPFVVVVVPTKSSIYPENHPDWLQRAGRQTRWEQLRDYLAQRSTVNVLDLTETLREAKKQQQVFYQTDSHWNGVGAFIGAQAILADLQRRGILPAQDAPKYSLDGGKAFSGDLARILGIEDRVSEPNPLMVLDDGSRYTFKHNTEGIPTWNPEKKNRPPFAVENETVKGPTAVFFHDSFGDGLVDYLAVDFKRIVFVHTGRGFDTTLLEHEKPDVVVWEMVERYLQLRVP